MRNRAKQIVSILLICVFTLSLLSACHGRPRNEKFAIPEEFDTSREYEISFWAKSDSNATQTAIYRKAIADFEALYPNIKVNYVPYYDYGRIYNDVITNISTGTTPNVCITYPDHIATYITGDNTVVALDELFDNEKYGLGGSDLSFDGPTRDEIIPKFLAECTINGEHYAIPYMRSTEACYVNKTYIEAMGYEIPEALTWDFIWEVSEAAMEKDADGNFKVNGQNVLIPFIYKSTDNMMIQMLRQLDAGYSTDSGEILLFNDTTKELLYTVAEHAGTRAFSTFKISSYPGNFFNAGQCLFAIDSTAGASWIGTNSPNSDIHSNNKKEFETLVMTIPQFNTEDPQMISQGPSICVFNKEDPQVVLASWLFAQFMLTNETQIAYSSTEGYVPVTSKAQDSAEYQDYLSREGEDNDLYYDVKIKAAKLLLENTDNTFVTPVFNGSANLRNAAGQLIENVAKSMRRNETVDEKYMSDLYKDVKSLYRLDQSAAVGRADLGALPSAASILLWSLGGIWILIGGFALIRAIKNVKK